MSVKRLNPEFADKAAFDRLNGRVVVREDIEKVAFDKYAGRDIVALDFHVSDADFFRLAVNRELDAVGVYKWEDGSWAWSRIISADLSSAKVAYPAGAANVKLVKRGGWCTLSGFMTGVASSASGSVILTVPNGFRPIEAITTIAVRVGSTWAVGNIDTDGAVKVFASASDARVDIPAVTYPVAG